MKPITFQTLHDSLARRVLLRAFFIASAMSVIPLVHILCGSYLKMFNIVSSIDCASEYGGDNVNLDRGKFISQTRFLNPIWGAFDAEKCRKDVNLTATVVKELTGKQLVNVDDKALCVGEGSKATVMVLQDLGFHNASGVYERRLFSFRSKQFVYEIGFIDKSFDFVLCRDLNKVAVPALLVLEVERVLKPGGIGVMLVGSRSSALNSPPISLLLKSSSVVDVSYISNFSLVVFRKSYENAGLFEQYRVPADCLSLMKNSILIEKMEPLVMEKSMEDGGRVTYLPNLVDVSSKQQLAYIDIGARRHLKSNGTNWFLPSYPITRNAFHTYFVDHNTSLLGIKDESDVNFEGEAEHNVAEEEFHFLDWFKETVQHAEFVVLKMNSGSIGLEFLRKLFESGAICFVDELFLNCSGKLDGEGTMPVDCINIFKSLRSSGVYVHQWGEDNPSMFCDIDRSS